MDRATRKELKSDKFALEVQHGVEYVTDHKKLVTQWGGIAVAVILVVLAVVFYMRYQRGVRLEALQGALRIQNAQVGPPNNEYTLFYPAQADKDKAVQKAWSDLAAKYSGSEVGLIAEYYLAGEAADHANILMSRQHPYEHGWLRCPDDGLPAGPQGHILPPEDSSVVSYIRVGIPHVGVLLVCSWETPLSAAGRRLTAAFADILALPYNAQAASGKAVPVQATGGRELEGAQ